MSNVRPLGSSHWSSVQCPASSFQSYVQCPGFGRPGSDVAEVAADLLPGQPEVPQPARVDVELVHPREEEIVNPRPPAVGPGPARHPGHDGRVPGVKLGQLAARARGLVVLEALARVELEEGQPQEAPGGLGAQQGLGGVDVGA